MKQAIIGQVMNIADKEDALRRRLVDQQFLETKTRAAFRHIKKKSVKQ